MSKSIPFSVLLLLPCAFPAAAQEISPADPLPEILVTHVSTGSEQPVEEVGQSVSVVGPEEIAAVQGPDLTRVLERLPGVTLTRNGGLGGFTGLRVRGANAEQLLVLVDGIRIADVAAPGGGTDLGNLISGGIGKIELLRGSNSVAWGSEAIGGVLALTSRELHGIEAAAEYGARDSFDGQATVGLLGGGHALTLTAGHTRSDGFSTAASGTEPDGFRQWRVSGRGRVALMPDLTAVATGRYADSRLDQDGFPAPSFVIFADTPDFQKTRDAAARGGLEYRGAGVALAGGLAWSRTQRAYFDPTFGLAPNYETDGQSIRAEAGGRIDLPADFALTFGGDSEWTRFSSTFDAPRRARLASGHALLGFHRGALDLTGGARLDDHDRFGSQWTFGANGSLALGGGWRARASYGEGFKAPTLFQLYSDLGNNLLVPEHSRSFDAGIELAERNAALHFAATVFRRDSRDLIDFVSCPVQAGVCAGRPFGTYDNIGAARAEGFELEAAAEPTYSLRLRSAYSYVKSVNRVTGRDLARRPHHALSLSGDWEIILDGLAFGADLRLVGDSFDDAAEAVPLEGHALLTLRASLPLGEQVEVLGRIENLGDVKYQAVAGYGTAGRSAFVGARARF